MILEREVEQYLRRLVTQAGGMCVKFIPDYMVGMPDRLCMFPCGRVVWVETKKPKGGVISDAQKFRHQQLRDLGFQVELCWTKEDAERIVNETTLQ